MPDFKSIWTEIKNLLARDFCFSHPAYLRRYGIRVIPVGARL